jgi:uncharacterized protein YhaN
LQIESLNITNFGGLHDLSLELSDGLTVIEGANESGKSTVAAFIKFMLYGFTDKNERTLRMSWEGKTAEGSMIVRRGGKRYRIGRRCRDGRDDFQIIELTGNTLCHVGRQPGEVFLGVGADVFAHTAYVNQLEGGRVNGEAVTEAIGNILFSADETLNVQRAQKRLEDERIRLWHKNKHGGRIYELESEREDLLERRRAASADAAAIISKEGQLTDLKAKIKENAVKIDKLSKVIAACEAGRRAGQRRAIAQLRTRLERLDEQRRELGASYRDSDGFLPGEEFKSELDSLKSGLDYIDRRIAELDTQHEHPVTADPHEMPVTVKLLRKHGGSDALMRRFEEARIRRRALIAFGIFFGILFIPAAVIAVSLMLLNITYGVIASLGALALMIGLVMCFVSSVKYTRTVDSLLDEFGADSASDFKHIVSEAAAYTEPSRGDSTAMLLEGERVRLNAQREAKLAELNNFVSRWGERTLEEALDDLSEYTAKLAECEAEYKKTEAELSGALAQIGDADEDSDEDPMLLELAARLPDDINVAAIKREHDFLSKANASMAARTHELELELAALNAKNDTPAKIADRITALDYELSRLRNRYNAVELAVNTLKSASENMRESLSPHLSEYAGNMMEVFSGGRYKSIAVATDFSLSYDAGTGAITRHGIEFMSAGTQDIAYLSLRLALIKVLFRQGNPPLIFDESFTRLDNERLRNVLRLLENATETGTQVIILTAQPREYAALTTSVRRIRI